MSPSAQTHDEIEKLLQKVDERERAARRHAVVYSLIPIIVAAVLLSITAWQVYNAERKVAIAKADLGTYQRALERLNVQQPNQGKFLPKDSAVGRPRPAVEDSTFGQLVRVSATPLTISTDRPMYDFRLWIDGNAETLNRIARVQYHFNHPTIRDPVQETSDRANNFRAGYRGWGCLRSVIVTFTLVEGKNPPPSDFDMCANLHWD